MIVKFFSFIKRNGILKTLKAIDIYLRSKYFFHSYRSRFTNKLYSELNGLVQYGPFKGMFISNVTHWNNFDILPKLLGTYERHIQEELIKIVNENQKKIIFIDIGAADGFYAVAISMQKNVFKTIAFEINPKSKEILELNAKINKVKKNKIKILCEGKKETILKELDHSENYVILIDIEGGEYDLLDNRFLEQLSKLNVTIIIELHEFTDGQKLKCNKLIEMSSKFFNIKYLKPLNIRDNEFDILNLYPDDLRYIAFSEQRPCKMRWIRITPK